MRIGFIGLGLMGHPMAKNILKKGGDLTLWSRKKEQADELIALGAKFCDKKNTLGESVDILITMVTAGEDVDEILFGDDGVASSMRAGSIVIDMSTIGVAWAEKISSKLGVRGIHFLDAPVTGSTPKAITGELTIFIGGALEIFEKARPVLSMMGTNLQYMGKNGRGQAMKLINNTMVAYSMIGLAEVMRFTRGLGLPLERTAEVIKTLPVSSPYIAMKVGNFVKDEYPMMFSLANMAKDLSLAREEMEKSGLSLEMLEYAEGLYRRGVNEGKGGLDVSAIGKTF